MHKFDWEKVKNLYANMVAINPPKHVVVIMPRNRASLIDGQSNGIYPVVDKKQEQ